MAESMQRFVAVCQCGCGKPTRIASANDPRYGQVAGQPVRFIQGHNQRVHPNRRGPNPLAVREPCACGCGELASRRFTAGHARRLVEGRDYIVDDAGCWLWGRKVDVHGYGMVKRDHRYLKAHRWAYELLVGPIPAEHVLHHICEVKRCVNPAHLRPMTNEQHSLLHEHGEAAVA